MPKCTPTLATIALSLLLSGCEEPPREPEPVMPVAEITIPTGTQAQPPSLNRSIMYCGIVSDSFCIVTYGTAQASQPLYYPIGSEEIRFYPNVRDPSVSYIYRVQEVTPERLTIRKVEQ